MGQTRLFKQELRAFFLGIALRNCQEKCLKHEGAASGACVYHPWLHSDFASFRLPPPHLSGPSALRFLSAGFAQCRPGLAIGGAFASLYSFSIAE